MIIRRYLPDKTFEDWKIKDLKKQTWWNRKLDKSKNKSKMAKKMICVLKQLSDSNVVPIRLFGK